MTPEEPKTMVGKFLYEWIWAYEDMGDTEAALQSWCKLDNGKCALVIVNIPEDKARALLSFKYDGEPV